MVDGLYESRYGVKSQLDVSFNGSLCNDTYDFKVVGTNKKSAAESDSGGAAFVKLNDGTWRYLGVIIATAPYPGDEFLFCIDDFSVKGTSLIYVKTFDY